MTAAARDPLPTVAVVLAGGTGSRVGLDLPKQLLKVAGRTIIEHTVEALHDCADVDETSFPTPNDSCAPTDACPN
jgi:2-C-methyl-D-erythritol 4-phosphate cytidylyltransferase